MPRAGARELSICTLLAAALALAQWWPALRVPEATGFGDWQMIHHNWEAAYVTLSRFGEWPLWDPFHCGGVPILGNPESQLYTPWFLLSFAFGTVVAVKLMLVGHALIAAVGMYWLVRRGYQLHRAAAALAAVAWSCSGWFIWDGAGGHATFFSFTFAPWLSYFIRRGRDPVVDATAVAALLTLSLLGGGTYPLPFFLIWISFELSLRAVRLRALWETVRFGALSLALLCLGGAIRLVPIFLTLQAYPRKVPNRDVLALADVWEMLTAREHAWRYPGHVFVWPEYGSYVGIAVVLLAALAVPLALRRSRRHLLVALTLYTSLMLGNLGPYAPYTLLHHLPVYDSLRVPSRFAVFVTFYVAVLAAHALDAGLSVLRRPRLASALGALSVLAVCADLLHTNWPTVQLWREPPLSAAPAAEAFHLVTKNYHAGYASFPRLNVGTRACYAGGMNWPVSPALWNGDQAQVRVPQGAGELLAWQRSPNRFQAKVALRSPTVVSFNQNFARGFVSDAETPPSAAEGLLALSLPAGERTVTVRYRPPELVPCAAASALGWLLMAAVPWLRSRRRSGA
jgi:hypothetical protein